MTELLRTGYSAVDILSHLLLLVANPTIQAATFAKPMVPSADAEAEAVLAKIRVLRLYQHRIVALGLNPNLQLHALVASLVKLSIGPNVLQSAK